MQRCGPTSTPRRTRPDRPLVVKVRDLDPIRVAKPYLEVHQDVAEWFGDSDWISALNEPPYPHLQMLDTPGGVERTRRWLIGREVTLKLFADFDGTPGKTQLHDGMGVILDALAELSEVPAEPGKPVITLVEFPGAQGYLPEPTGQMVYMSRVLFWMHPATKEAVSP